MKTTYSVEYYKGLWNKWAEFDANNKNRSSLQRLIKPDLYFIQPASKFLAERVLYPVLNRGYAASSVLAVKAAEVFSKQLAHLIDEAWNDPIETETLVRIGEWAMTKSLPIANQRPTQVPLLYYFHRATIVAARHVFVFTKDATTILKIPGQLHSYISGYIDQSTVAAPKNQPPKTLLGRVWVVAVQATAKLQEAILFLVHKVIQATEIPLRHMPLINGLLKELREDVELASDYLHKRTIQTVQHFLVDKEKVLRRKVVAKVAEVSTKKGLELAISLGIKFTISAAVYGLARHAFVEYTGSHEVTEQVERVASIVLRISGAYLWVACMTPTIQQFHDDYTENFDTDASLFKELKGMISTKNFFHLIQLLKNKI